MTTISKNAPLVTFINVFTVEPTNQGRLVDLLTEVTDRFVRHAPGFVSSALHRSLDGTRVTMYAQWRTIEDYEAMRRDPAPAPFLQDALTIAKFEPGRYEVVESFVPGVLDTSRQSRHAAARIEGSGRPRRPGGEPRDTPVLLEACIRAKHREALEYSQDALARGGMNGRIRSMTSGAKLKVSLTLSADLVALVDRDARRGKGTRSGVVEQWLRRAASSNLEQEIDDATAAYYRSLRGEDRAEDESLSRSLSDAARRVAFDDDPAPRGRQARR